MKSKSTKSTTKKKILPTKLNVNNKGKAKSTKLATAKKDGAVKVSIGRRERKLRQLAPTIKQHDGAGDPEDVNRDKERPRDDTLFNNGDGISVHGPPGWGDDQKDNSDYGTHRR